MKRNFAKTKSFTLIELLVSVTIFVVVTVVVISILSITVSSKSKIKAINQLRTEGSMVMAEAQDMVEKGNYFSGGNAGVVIKPDNVYMAANACVPLTETTPLINDMLGSFYMDPKGALVGRDLSVNSSRIQLLKTITPPGSPINSQTGYLTSEGVQVTKFYVYGLYRNPNIIVCGQPTKVVIDLGLKVIASGSSGQDSTLNIISTFTPKYPGPDLAGDSVQ
ncbi:MAG: hypothetical protein HW405_185 [Candidatus Berkelbacteria bacterium]|nr:hypothetical protein [Candidatus Berkelbacteria bacterium]